MRDEIEVEELCLPEPTPVFFEQVVNRSAWLSGRVERLPHAQRLILRQRKRAACGSADHATELLEHGMCVGLLQFATQSAASALEPGPEVRKTDFCTLRNLNRVDELPEAHELQFLRRVLIAVGTI